MMILFWARDRAHILAFALHSSSQEPQCSAGGSAAQGLDASSHDDADDMIR